MYIDVILPLPLEGSFSYHVPDDIEGMPCVGGRVVVPFGTAKFHTGIVTNIYNDKPQGEYTIKDIIEIVDRQPSVTPQQIKLWQWISQYYICPLGDVFKAAVPSGMKLESETRLQPVEGFDNWEKLTRKEMDILELIQDRALKTVSQVQKVAKEPRLAPVLRSLMKKNALEIREEMKKAFSPKTETHVRLAKAYRSEDALNTLAQQLEKQPKRYNLLMKYLDLSGMVSALKLHNEHLIQEVSKSTLLNASDISAAVLIGMRSKGYFETYDYEVGRIRATSGSSGNSSTKGNRCCISFPR